MRSTCTKYAAFLFLFVCLLKSKTYTQEEHFIYIQADANQVFNVVVNNKNYTSSDIGYLIIPALLNGNWNVAVSFPEDKTTQLNFPLMINGKDEGFQLKNFGAKGWGLFNLQTMDVVFSGAQISPTDQPTTTVKSKAFGDMLGDVVNDSTLNKSIQKSTPSNASVAANTVSPTIVQPVANNSPVVEHMLTPNVQPVINTETTVQNLVPAGVSKGMIKARQQSDETGTSVTFVNADDKNDTVNIFIPAVETSAVTNNNIIATPQNTLAANAPVPSTTQNNSAETKNPFYTSSNNAANTTASNNTIASAPQVTNASCSQMADENDLYKLRKKMISQTDANAMIMIAKKQLNGKCVSTDQVKNMGILFLSDESRYDFYEAMYKFTYDPANYNTLQSQLIDDYYKRRFQSLLH
jgi:hypothetical protein